MLRNPIKSKLGNALIIFKFSIMSFQHIIADEIAKE